MSLGLGASLSTVRNVSTPPIVTSGLVLKQNYDTGAVVPISDGAAYFDGATNRVDCGTGMSDITSGAFSIGGLYRVVPGYDIINDGGLSLFSRGDGTSTSGYAIQYHNSGGTPRIISYQRKTGAYNYIAHNVTLTPGQWYHIVWVNGGTGVESSYYIDGVQVVTKTHSQDIISASSVPLYLGSNSAANTSWAGNICNMGMWTSALTQPQIKSIMYKNYAGLNASETTNLVSWWSLGEETATDGTAGTGGVKDYHGSNNGTLS